MVLEDEIEDLRFIERGGEREKGNIVVVDENLCGLFVKKFERGGGS